MNEKDAKNLDELAKRLTERTMKFRKTAQQRIVSQHDRIHGLTDTNSGDDFNEPIAALVMAAAFDILLEAGMSKEAITDVLTSAQNPFQHEHLDHTILAYMEMYDDLIGEV